MLANKMKMKSLKSNSHFNGYHRKRWKKKYEIDGKRERDVHKHDFPAMVIFMYQREAGENVMHKATKSLRSFHP